MVSFHRASSVSTVQAAAAQTGLSGVNYRLKQLWARGGYMHGQGKRQEAEPTGKGLILLYRLHT